MPRPLTLLQMQGALGHPAPLADAALLLIDIQEEYRTGLLPLHRVTEAAEAAGVLLALARAEGVPVFHIRHRLRDDAPIFNPGLPGFAFLPEVAPRSGEPLVDKALPNAFAGTGLEDLIRGTGRRELVVAGMQTHLCVSATVRAALDLGYRTTVAAAACATRDLPDGSGGIVAAAEVHRVALAELADAFATVVPDASVWAGG